MSKTPLSERVRSDMSPLRARLMLEAPAESSSLEAQKAERVPVAL